MFEVDDDRWVGHVTAAAAAAGCNGSNVSGGKGAVMCEGRARACLRVAGGGVVEVVVLATKKVAVRRFKRVTLLFVHGPGQRRGMALFRDPDWRQSGGRSALRAIRQGGSGVGGYGMG